MSEQATSYRRILKSSSVIGGASVINILIGLVRTKVVALLLGPAGIGLVSLYSGLMSTATSVATMGVGTVGTRQIAEAIGKEDVRALALVRRAMFWGTLILASAGALVVWSFRELFAVHVLGGEVHAATVGWLALGVALSVAGASQGALIQGMRRIGDMARLSVLGSLFNTLLGVALLWQWGDTGLVAYVLVGPFVSFVLGQMYVSRLPKSNATDISLAELTREWEILLKLGIPFMGAGLAGSLIQLWIRVEVGNTLGTEALGHFQAAWVISMQYIGFVLGAMGADYYPRLTQVIGDRMASVRLVNEQTEIALLLSAPVFIAMMALAPWVIQILYSAAFAPAVSVLHWQILGDVFKVASWPLGFVILAAGDGKTFFFAETSTLLIMGGLIVGLLPLLGLQITGIAFLVSYCYLLLVVYLLAWRRIGFRWSDAVVRLLSFTFVLCVFAAWVASMTRWGFLVGCGIAVMFGIYTLARLSHMSDIGGPVGRLGAMVRGLAAKIGM